MIGGFLWILARIFLFIPTPTTLTSLELDFPLRTSHPLWNGVESGSTKGLAPQQPPDNQPKGWEKRPPDKCLLRVMGAAWHEAASSTHEPAEIPLVSVNQKKQHAAYGSIEQNKK